MANNLNVYHRKRNFKQTPEPKGARAKPDERLQFVVQKHDARRLHYDFRLEHDGVLKSWAVPKAPSLDPKDRRLAVQTEDHPLDYATFEGVIPERQYGAGSVLIWDRGYWTPIGDPETSLADGKLDFELEGERLNGRWTLVRMAKRDRPKGPDNWLLIKRSEKTASAAKTKPATVKKQSPAVGKRATAPGKRGGAAASKGVTVRKGKGKGKGKAAGLPGKRRAATAAAKLGKTRGARRGALPKTPLPQLATPVKATPNGADWLLEPKLDGYRLLCRIEKGKAKLLTRRGNDWTDRFSAIAASASTLPCKSALLDGEAAVFDARGLTDFQSLQNAIARDDSAIVFVAFDLLHLDGWNLHDTPLRARKELLQGLLAGATDPLRYGEHVEESGDAFFREACRLGLEGVIAKRADDPYREGRSKSWLKVKCIQRQEFVIVGFTEPSGSRTGLGALLVGSRKKPGGPLHYSGKVGTGFDERSLRMLRGRLDKLIRRTPPVEAASARGAGRDVHWVKPDLIAEIAFSEWTTDGRLRHPTFRGLREDKIAPEVVEEHPVDEPKRGGKPAAKRKAKSAAKHKAAPAAQRAVKLTSPDKLLWPKEGITKRQLADYWEQVAEYALPWIEQRPLSLFRCPGGYESQCFYQKHVGAGVPDAVPRVMIDEGEDPYAMIDSLPALLGLVQISVLELHVWGSRAEHLDQPDIIVFDLDPAEELPWSEVVSAGFKVKERLEGLGLNSFARLTGGKGLHLVVPVVPGPDWAAVKTFSRAVVIEMTREEPKRFTASVSKSKRVGKIFIDYLRNDRGSTAIASYSPRARAGAPIALPVEWDELDPKAKKPPRFGLLEVPKLLARRKRDPWADFESARRSLVD